MKLSFYTLYFLILIFKVKIPAVQPKRLKRCFCDDCKTVDPPCLSHRENTRESHPVVSEVEVLSFFSLENAILWASEPAIGYQQYSFHFKDTQVENIFCHKKICSY